jgi:hypothetical protein
MVEARALIFSIRSVAATVGAMPLGNLRSSRQGEPYSAARPVAPAEGVRDVSGLGIEVVGPCQFWVFLELPRWAGGWLTENFEVDVPRRCNGEERDQNRPP